MSDSPPIVVPPPASTPPEPLAKLPYPLFVRILAAITVSAFLLGLVRLPRALHYGIEEEQGRRLLASGSYVEAERKLEDVVKAFPEAKDTRIDYAEACVKANDPENAAAALFWFQGKEVSKEQNARLDEIEAEGDRQFKKSAGGGE